MSIQHRASATNCVADILRKFSNIYAIGGFAGLQGLQRIAVDLAIFAKIEVEVFLSDCLVDAVVRVE